MAALDVHEQIATSNTAEGVANSSTKSNALDGPANLIKGQVEEIWTRTNALKEEVQQVQLIREQVQQMREACQEIGQMREEVQRMSEDCQQIPLLKAQVFDLKSKVEELEESYTEQDIELATLRGQIDWCIQNGV